VTKQVTFESYYFSHPWVLTHGQFYSTQRYVEKFRQIFRGILFTQFVFDNTVLLVKVKISTRTTVFVLGSHDHHNLVVSLGTLLFGVGYENFPGVVLDYLFGYALAMSKGMTNTRGTVTGNTLMGSPGTHVVKGISVTVICYLELGPGFMNKWVF